MTISAEKIEVKIITRTKRHAYDTGRKDDKPNLCTCTVWGRINESGMSESNTLKRIDYCISSNRSPVGTSVADAPAFVGEPASNKTNLLHCGDLCISTFIFHCS